MDSMPGNPLHAWKEEVFVKIAEGWGALVKIDDATLSRQKLEVARFAIRTSHFGLQESDEEAMNAGQVSSAFLPREPNLEIFNPNPSINELTKNVQEEPQNNDDHLEFEFCKGKRRICRRECRWEGGAKPGVPVVGEEK
ncbi:hypothetical protein Ancab_007541 [Ancistrocladus abbreviatus]